MFFTKFVLCILRLFNSKEKAKQYTKIFIARLQNSNKNFADPGAPVLGLDKDMYITLCSRRLLHDVREENRGENNQGYEDRDGNQNDPAGADELQLTEVGSRHK